ncbi:uncharacterized protein L203_101146 [Cryptococcus depauperatus CBS 7841]|uniref:Uncharacterized protein n=1 Tax=Cryptococcus depauperatus CBS 7841 TaxID=1295531 RepID=A0A1E3IK49_9TREE|nr:hypothetical protein L203_02385 [Cryptococcus depauperatus CBS 7841]
MATNNADDALSASPEDAASASTASFVTSLFVNGGVAGGAFIAFVILRRWLKAIYEPRTYIPPKEKQAPVLGSHLLWPLWTILWSDPEDILKKNGVDPYMFVRFVMMMAKAMIPVWLISWAVLLPAYSKDSRVDGKEGLDKFTFGNVAHDKQSRYWAPLILDYVFIFWFFYVIWHEMKHWLVIRQKHLVSPSHSKLPQANTVLVTGIPRHYLDEEKLGQLFSHLPGGVKRVWLNRNLKEMPNLYNRRNRASKMLEIAQVELIKTAREFKRDRDKKIQKLHEKDKPVPFKLLAPANNHPHSKRLPSLPPRLPPIGFSNASTPNSIDTENISVQAMKDELELVDRLVPHRKRPKHYVKPRWAPFSLTWLKIGHRVDTIEWAREEIMSCTVGLEKSRATLLDDIRHPGKEDHYPPLSSAFILFNQQIAAHMAVQCLTHNQPYVMNARFTEQSPSNIIWRNLSLNQYERNVRQAISWAATGGLIFAWTFPVAFIGAMSNVATLTSQFKWLAWIAGNSFDKKLLQGVFSGILPPVLLELLMMALPVILRHLAVFEGVMNKTGVELDLMTRYFIFLVIHTFFVITLSAGLISSLHQFANNPQSIATTLASQMPTASTFFITLVLTQFTGTMGTLLRLYKLTLYYVKIILQGGTPRSVYATRYILDSPCWGETFPGITVYAVMMIAYCVISPIINGLGAAFFLFASVVYKFHYIWVIDQPPSSDTGGLFFPKAITHLFVGMYVQEICMTALFFLARNEHGKPSALPQGALMIVLMICTIFFQYTIIVQYSPLKHCLPLSLAHLSYGMAEEDNHESSVIGEDYDNVQENEKGAKHHRFQFASFKQHLVYRPESDGTKEHVDSLECELSPVTPNSEKDEASQSEKNRSGTMNSSIGETEKDNFCSSKMSDLELGVLSVDASSPRKTHDSTCRPSLPHTTVESVDTGHVSNRHRYFAVPGGAGVINQQFKDEETAFFHPASKESQKVIWLPEDELGLCKAEVRANERAGVKSSLKGAWLNEKGKVQISMSPPEN